MRARLIGARALQISMGAPLLVKLTEEDLDRINYNPVDIAKMELEKGTSYNSKKTNANKGRINFYFYDN